MPQTAPRRYGPLDPTAIAALTGKQILLAMLAGELPAPPMAQTLGFDLVEVGDGFAAFAGAPTEALLNPMGTVHGGWALTMVDSAAGCAALSLQPAGTVFTTIETKVNFSRPILKDAGLVRCEARIVAAGRRILSAEARVTDASGKLLAHGTSTVMAVTGA